ncbi:LytTR family DNA-binding domain-containing protein [Sphingobacterium sp. BIGb0116]|uniref:LytR/AlgR family response regulator transcription factor n=1 Tax=Sphingobacterium sp. BIGb0116 TaxID=2940619 RepID=UPI0021676164|nr:LytTR family DNA-binding domain-containing protein [Sphingobacterium sp. BIGb0116]MCS4164814.1 DNA-binding LytR/AlgR family response regulator [Sphingobacterium sp. BIGb0116]
MISYLIIDDEHIAHDIIKGYCDLIPNMRLMKNCYDALEALEFLHKNEVDLIFLDLNMPVLKGFEFLKTLQNPPKVIVTTAYQEFALEGYEHNISDYLLKPFGFERFLKAVNKSMSSVVQKAPAEKNDVPNRIFVQSNKKHIQLETENILYIEATGNYTKIITPTGPITIREKFSAFLEQLPKNDFVQVHKSFAVAAKQINSVEGNMIFISNYQVPIGKIYKMNMLKLLR